MRSCTLFEKIAVCMLSASIFLTPSFAFGADIQNDPSPSESQIDPAADPNAETETTTPDSQTEDTYGVDAYANLEYLYQNFPQRTNEENNRSANVTNAGLWIQSQLESYGYEVSTHDYVHFNFTGTNYFVTKPGASEKTIVIGAHYDSMPTAGVDDNGSGVSVLLELAKRFHDVETPCTLQFVFFDTEEYGDYAGSSCFVYTYLIPNNLLDNILCCINIDSIAGGDRLYGYGGEYNEDGELTREWVYDEANLIADDLGLDLYTLPEQVEEFQSPTRLLGSDSYYFAKEGIPYLYMEASLWCNDDGTGGNEETHLTCHYQTANEAFASTGGQIMHTEFDDLNLLNELLPGRIQKNLHDASAIVTGMLLDISPSTEAGIEAGKAAALAAQETPADESATDDSLSSSEDDSKDNSTEANSDNANSIGSDESLETESVTDESASLEEPNESAAPVIESDHKFMTGLFAAAAIVLILFVVFLLTAALTASSRRRKRIRRFGDDYKRK